MDRHGEGYNSYSWHQVCFQSPMFRTPHTLCSDFGDKVDGFLFGPPYSYALEPHGSLTTRYDSFFEIRFPQLTSTFEFGSL